MLTCSGVAVCRTLVGGQLLLQNPSYKSCYFSLKKCVQKFTTPQQCSISTLSLLSSAENNLYSVQIMSRRRRRHHCYSLNFNHHITFNYINSSIVINRFHQSTYSNSNASQTAADGSEVKDGSINSLCHVVNDSRKPELSTDTLDGLEETQPDYENEDIKEQVWGIGPALLPTFNVGAYANESENVKRLIQLGVDLSEWEARYGTIPILYKSNFDKTMQPIIRFLEYNGVEGPDLSRVLTMNPFIFDEDVRNLEKRIDYLRFKEFSTESIQRMITRNPYWLSFSVPRIDRRLGFYQTFFGLTGNQVRELATAGSSGPKLITYHLGLVKDVTFTIKEEMGFTSEEIVKLLLARPRLWKETPVALRRRFDYLHNEEKFSHEYFLRCPMLLLTRERRMKERIGFLRKLGRAQFDPTKPNYISAEKLCTGIDTEFATNVAKCSVIEYNNYLMTL